MISRFDGQYAWLSNFHPCDVQWQSAHFKSVEAFYQAMKSNDPTVIGTFVNMTAREAKKAGRKAQLRPDWEQIKVSVMLHGLRCKFNWDLHPDLALALIKTGNEILLEGNYWHDNYWGDCYCAKCKEVPGLNMLGKLIMETRDWLNEMKAAGHLSVRDGYESSSTPIVVNLRTEPCDIRIDRKSKWGNPFKTTNDSDAERNRVCDEHMSWLCEQTELLNDLHELVGKRLGCWCAPKRCHGDNLILLMKVKELI